MSTTRFSFKAKLLIGEEVVPLVSEVVTGDAESKDGVSKGFLFKLDLQPNDPPVVVNLGAVIDFIQSKLGSAPLDRNPGLGTLEKVFPGIDRSSFNSGNTALIEIKSFVINSTTDAFLFAFSVDVEGSDPTKGFIPLPEALVGWLSIDNIAISFSATSSSPGTAEGR